MASIINVDTINEKTSGNGVQIPGHVVQTVHFTTGTQVSTASTSAVVTNLSGSITPKYSTSHIYVILHQRVFANPGAGGSAGDWGLERSTDGGNTFSQIYVRGRTGLTDNTGGCDVQASTMFKDSPAITTAVNYRTTIRNNAGAGNVYANLDNALATMTIMEIAQ
tara:strand:+ start:36235 stop:36729 length:495 start_codon:yes stop_codon:yes gene_type:complete